MHIIFAKGHKKNLGGNEAYMRTCTGKIFHVCGLSQGILSQPGAWKHYGKPLRPVVNSPRIITISWLLLELKGGGI